MEEIGTVTSVSQKHDPEKYGISLGKDNWFNGFGTAPCNKGDRVKIDYEQNNAFKNIKKVEVLFTKAPAQTDNQKAMQEASILKNKTNARCSALTNATNLCIAEYGDKINKELVLATANAFLLFIDG